MYKIFKINLLFALTVVMLIVLITVNPVPCREGAAEGLLLCGRVIIPAIFPFTFCVLFIMKTGLLEKTDFLKIITKRLFGLSPQLFSLALISFIGGYPIGAKLLNTAVEERKISRENAGVMLNYCINAGPAFVISAVGSGILSSRKLGIILFISHVAASLILCMLSGFRDYDSISCQWKKSDFCLADNFVMSVKEAADTTISISSFVILFSAFNRYLEIYSAKIPFLKYLPYFTEITNSLTLTNNIYIIAFLLGFGGLSIWFQVMAMGKNIKIKPLGFIIFRILHGFLSSLLTFGIIRVFKITVPTFSNGRRFSQGLSYSTSAVSVSLVIMFIVLMISLSTKKYTGKIMDDMI